MTTSSQTTSATSAGAFLAEGEHAPQAQPVEPVYEEPPTPQRTTYMAALSALEQILAATPVLPHFAQVSVPSFTPRRPEIVLHCDSPQTVQALADHFDGDVTVTEPHTETDPRVYTQVHGSHAGVPFRGWSLSEPTKPQQEQAEYRPAEQAVAE